MNKKSILISATSLAGLAVVFGAFGAHALKDLLTQTGRLDTFETGVRYQMYHALALFIVGSLFEGQKNRRLSIVAWLFLMGIFLFSGSLYVLSILSIRSAAYLTPIGGLLMVGGWILLLVHLCKTFPSTDVKE
jgi:uncharacterized membrane protein YgdD (TMEM256/DUF423 family)